MSGREKWPWAFSLAIVALIGLALASPDLAQAASNSGTGSFGIDDTVAKDTVSSTKSYWDLISAVAIYGGISVAIIMIPINKLWMGVAALVAFFGAFGEQIAKFIVRKAGGGASKYLDQSGSLSSPDQMVALIPSHDQLANATYNFIVAAHQPDSVVAAFHNALTFIC